MKFKVERDVLSEAVGWTARSLAPRPSMPVLAGVRVTAADGVVELATYDYEVSARSQIPAEVEESGTVLVSGRLLADISKALPDKPVTLALEGTKVIVTCGASRFTLMTMPVEEYPQLPQMPELAGVVDSDEFTKAVNQVTVAASKDDTLPLLTGVRIEISGENITLLATDRYRLALRELTWRPASPDAEIIALVKGRTLTDVVKALGQATEIEVALSSGSSKDIVGFEASGRHTTSTLLDGDYPPVRRLFPESSPIHAVVNRQALIDAARRVSLVAERNTPVRLVFTDGQLQLDAGQGDDAQASEVLDATLSGEEISVAFNPHYLLDGLGAINHPYIRFSFTQPTKPVEFTGQDEPDSDDDSSYRYLLVPIRFTS